MDDLIRPEKESPRQDPDRRGGRLVVSSCAPHSEYEVHVTFVIAPSKTDPSVLSSTSALAHGVSGFDLRSVNVLLCYSSSLLKRTKVF